MINQNINDFRDLMDFAFENGKNFVMPVNGTSMLPFLDSRMSVELKKVNSVEELKVNDMVLYIRKNGHYVLHRIRKIDKKNNNELYLVGDHQHIVEKGVYFNDIVAKVDKVINVDGSLKKTKGLKYNLYLMLWHNFFLRRVFIKIFRIR